MRITAYKLPLRARDGSVRAYALVSPEDFERVSKYRWCLNGKGYVRRGRTLAGNVQQEFFLHREIMGLPPKKVDPREVDHENRNPLDNRRANLRIVTHAQNHHNRPANANGSGARGVFRYKDTNRWIARARLNGKPHHVGVFDTAEEAADAVRAWRLAHMSHATD